MDDAAGLASLITELGYETDAEAMRTRLGTLEQSPQRQTFVFEEDGELLGMIGLVTNPYYERDGIGVQIAALVVTDAARGKGVGAELVRRGEAWAREQDADLVWLTSNVRREDAHRFYAREGYDATGVRFVKEL